MFVCNMRRTIINWLLLVSLAAAVPGARHKRHLSYLTNLFSSALFGQDQDDSSQLGYSITEPKYKLYQVPGFDDILIKSVTSAPVIVKTVLNNPGEVIEPFDSYIGTNNPQESLVALQHVNNLLSTGILNGQQTNMLKETLIPMTSGINLIPQEQIGPVPVISESIKPIQTDVLVNPYGEDDNLVDTFNFNPRYSYKQVEVTNPQVIVKQEFDRPANIPLCIDQRIDEVVSLGTNPCRISSIQKVMPIGSYSVTNGQYPSAVYRFPSLRSDETFKVEILERTENYFVEDTNQKNNLFNPLTHANKSAYINQAHNPKKHSATPNKSKPNNKHIKSNNTNVVLTANKEPADQTGTERVTEEVPPKGTLSYYIYEHERNKPKPFSKLEHKSDVNNSYSIRYVYIPPDYNRLAKEDLNIEKTADYIVPADNAQKDARTSHYAYKQASRNGPNAFTMVKEGDHLITEVHTNSSLSNQHAYTTPEINTTPVDSDGSQNGQFSFKNNPIVVADRNYAYNQSNYKNGNSVSVKGNKDGISVNVNVNGMPSKGRGDIPGE